MSGTGPHLRLIVWLFWFSVWRVLGRPNVARCTLANYFPLVNSLDSIYDSTFATLVPESCVIIAQYLTNYFYYAIILSIMLTTEEPELLLATQGLGFSETEARVYLATLQLGLSSIWDIALKSGVKRPTCYVVLDELVSQGFASKTHDPKRTLYAVESPRHLLRVAEKRSRAFHEVLPQLEQVVNSAATKPNIRLYEGKPGMKQAYALTLEQPRGTELLFIGTAPSIRSPYKLPDRYIAERVAARLPARALIPASTLASEIASRDSQELRQTRVLPADKLHTEVEVIIFGQSIAYLAHSDERPFATVIENAAIAEEERQRFDLLWELASPAV